MSVSRVNKEATEKLQDALRRAKEELAAGAGLALAQWSVVESMLSFVFVATLDRSSKPAGEGMILWEDELPQRRIYTAVISSVISFEVRVDMVSTAVAESDLRKDLKRLWPGIAARLKKSYKSRHEAAHFIFDQIHGTDGSVKLLLAPFPSIVVTLEAKRLNRQELDRKASRFQELGDALRWFWSAIEIQRRRDKGPRGPAPALIQRVRQSLETQIE
jgi:hypothetical protein